VKWLSILLLSAASTWAAETAATLARNVDEAGFDPAVSYRVRNLAFQKEDLKLYLTDGYLLFGKPVEGRPIAVLFSADRPGGDGEIIVLPPSRSERLSLAAFTNSPNLDEHLRLALFIFTDKTGGELLEQVKSSQAKLAPEEGILLAGKHSSALKNLTRSFSSRIVQDLLWGQPELGFFYAAMQGKLLGNFDALYDPRSREQVHLGQVTFRQNRSFWDTWASFPARSFRLGRKQAFVDPLRVPSVRIEAALDQELAMKATTTMQVSVERAVGRAISFDISRRMRVTGARLNGIPVEVFVRESMRSNLVRGNQNEMFLVVPPEPLTPGKSYTLEIDHEGAVVDRSGNGVYFVGARASWFPSTAAAFSTYDLSFRYPKHLTLVATGKLVEEKTEGEEKITRRRTDAPIRFAGFNLGEYEKASVQKAGLKVEVFANRKAELALHTQSQTIVMPPPNFSPRNRRQGVEVGTIQVPPPDPTARLKQLANDVSSVMEFYTTHFGPPPLDTLTVSPIPGGFGQGFAGLIYLSTLAYLNAHERPAALRTADHQTFFSELLHAHEAAHQWWGNLVTSSNYQDDWLMEGMASYAALLYLEKKKGNKALQEVLDDYRRVLLENTESGKTRESAGPIIWGTRLDSSQTVGTWQPIVYYKGAWIFHMLRAQLGDAAFFRMLGETVRRFQHKGLTTEQFQAIAAEFLPKGSKDPKLEAFFEQWVYGTGIPTYKVVHTVVGKAPKVKVRATLTQTGVDEDFSALVPIEVQLPQKRTSIRWIRSSSEPVVEEFTVPQTPVRVTVNPGNGVLAK
jgi:hypothetical protein